MTGYHFNMNSSKSVLHCEFSLWKIWRWYSFISTERNKEHGSGCVYPGRSSQKIYIETKTMCQCFCVWWNANKFDDKFARCSYVYAHIYLCCWKWKHKLCVCPSNIHLKRTFLPDTIFESFHCDGILGVCFRFEIARTHTHTLSLCFFCCVASILCTISWLVGSSGCGSGNINFMIIYPLILCQCNHKIGMLSNSNVKLTKTTIIMRQFSVQKLHQRR